MKISAGLLMYRFRDGNLEVFLVHPGGPLWQKKNDGAWTVSKGELAPGEEALEAAGREFEEETGFIPHGPFLELTPIQQKGGKIVRAWAFPGDCDPVRIKSNTFSMEWPPHSGRKRDFPEIDRAAFFGIEEAKRKINQAQVALLDELVRKFAGKED
ncbi:MAG: NUDIX domain-containing protein [Acidobacteriia bacterium]|nr:NUDIX domain-containing protein [Terriglobia bacterium]